MYWILFKFLLTAVATIVLLLKLEPSSHLADMATETTFSSASLMGLRTSLVVHAGGGLLVLLAATALAVYKPRGMTRYGRRKQYERSETEMMLGSGSIVSTPRWVKVFGFVVVLVLLVGIMMIGGGHGPGAHMP